MRKLRIGMGWLCVATLFVAVGSSRAEDTSVETEKGGEAPVARALMIARAASASGAYMGVTVREETEREGGGARVEIVVDDSGAAAAGLEPGDVIVRFDGERVYGPASLTKRISEREPGEIVSIEYVRNGESEAVDVELGERKGPFGFSVAEDGRVLRFGSESDAEVSVDVEKLQERIAEQARAMAELHLDGEGNRFRVFSWRMGRPRLGVHLSDMTPELREHMGASRDAGVLVSKVLRGTPAEAADIRVGDVIVRVGGEPVESSGDLIRIVSEADGVALAIEVVRDGAPVSLEATLPEAEEDAYFGPRASSDAERPFGVSVGRFAPRVEDPPGVARTYRVSFVPGGSI